MTMDDIVLRIRDLIENETRSCSMDFGCITPLYVYRMLGGAVSLEKIEQVMSNIKGGFYKFPPSKVLMIYGLTFCHLLDSFRFKL